MILSRFWKALFQLNELDSLVNLVNLYWKENQSLTGRIKILEEQQDIMHNFLVEINKYLYNQGEKNDLSKNV